MKIEYENAPEDIQAMVRALPWRTRLELLFTAPGMVVGSTLPTAVMLLSAGDVINGGFLVLAASLLSIRFLWVSLRLFRKSPVTQGKIVLRLTPDYLEIVHAEGSSRQAWAFLLSVSRVDGAIVIMQPMNRGFIIPDRAFETPKTVEQFYQTAFGYHAQARDQETVNLGDDVETFLPAWTQETRHSIQYQNTIGEWAHAITMGPYSSQTTIWGYLSTIMYCGFGYAVLTLLVFDLYGSRGPRISAPSSLDFVFIVAAMVFTVIMTFSLLLKCREIANRWRVPATAIEPHALKIAPQGMVIRWRLAITATRWPALSQIVPTDAAISVYDSSRVIAVIIPKRAFAESEAANTFAEEMVAWQASAIEASSNNGGDSVAELVEAEAVDGDNPYRSPKA